MRRPGQMRPPASLSAKVMRPPVRARRQERRAAPVGRKHDTNPAAASEQSPDTLDNDPRPLLFVILLGLSGAQLRQQCETIAEQVRRRGTAPLFLVDDDTSLAHLRHLSVLFEFVPSNAARTLVSPPLQWDLYDRRRAKLLHGKWQPAAVIAVGRTAREFAALMPPIPRQPKANRGVRLRRRLGRLFQ